MEKKKRPAPTKAQMQVLTTLVLAANPQIWQHWSLPADFDLARSRICKVLGNLYPNASVQALKTAGWLKNDGYGYPFECLFTLEEYLALRGAKQILVGTMQSVIHEELCFLWSAKNPILLDRAPSCNITAFWFRGNSGWWGTVTEGHSYNVIVEYYDGRYVYKITHPKEPAYRRPSEMQSQITCITGALELAAFFEAHHPPVPPPYIDPSVTNGLQEVYGKEIT